jgi:hypothetical protein
MTVQRGDGQYYLLACLRPFDNWVGQSSCRSGRRWLSFGRCRGGKDKRVDDSRRREILNHIDEITKQIWQHEESRQKIDQLYEELYQRIRELRDDVDEGKAK